MPKLSVRPLPAPFYPIIFLLFYTLTFLLFSIYSLGFLPFYFSIVRGLVIKNTGSWYTVKTEDGKTIDSKIKGNFRLKGIRSTNPVAVGDHVVITPNQELHYPEIAQPLKAEPYHRSQHRPGVPYCHRELSRDIHHLHRPFPRRCRGLSHSSDIGVQQARPAFR